MKKKWTGIRAVFTVCAALGWWGFLYPELTLTPDTYRVVREGDDTCSEEEMSDEEQDIYCRLLEADKGRIHFKSRLFLELKDFLEQFIQ